MKTSSKKGITDSDINKNKKLTRRGLWPLLAGGLLIPFFGMGKTKKQKTSGISKDKAEYDTLLKPDGTIVKVKKNTLASSNVVKKNMSNKSLLEWLTNK